MTQPHLSICIPNYNMGQWVITAVRSALMQPGCEVVVVDNASTDDSAKLIKGLSDVRLVSHLSDHHVPMYENINRAVSLSSGQWCLILCADDELTASFYGQFLQCYEQHPEAVAISQSAIDPDVPVIVGDTYPVVYRDPFTFLRSPTLPLSTTAFCRSAFDSIGGFSPEAGWAADWDLWMRLILDGGAAVAAGVPGGLYHRSRGAWSTAEGSPRELEWMKMWVDHRRQEWPTDVIQAMDLLLGARSEHIGRLLLDQRDSAGLELLATAAALGSKTAARRLWLERYTVVARAYDTLHAASRQAVRRLEVLVR